MNLPRLYPDFADLLGCLIHERVEFLLVGASVVAANVRALAFVPPERRQWHYTRNKVGGSRASP